MGFTIEPSVAYGVKKHNTTRISRDEWLDAYNDAMRSAPTNDPSALTTNELAEKWKIGERHARRVILRLVKTGRATIVRKRVLNTQGFYITVPAYKLKSK